MKLTMMESWVRQKEAHKVPSTVRFADRPDYCPPDIGEASPPAFFENISMLDSSGVRPLSPTASPEFLSISQVTPPRFMADVKLLESLDISSLDRTPSTILTTLGSVSPQQGSVFTPSQSASELSRDLNQAYFETSHVTPFEDTLPEFSFVFSPSRQRFVPIAISSPAEEGFQVDKGVCFYRCPVPCPEPRYIFQRTPPVQVVTCSPIPCPEPPYVIQRTPELYTTAGMPGRCPDFEQMLKEEEDEDTLMMWGLAMRREKQPLNEFYEQLIMASPNIIKSPKLLATLRKEYIEKKHKVIMANLSDSSELCPEPPHIIQRPLEFETFSPERPEFEQILKEEEDEDTLLMWGFVMRRDEQPLSELYERLIMASPNIIKDPKLLYTLRKEYIKKKDRVRWRQLPEEERNRVIAECNRLKELKKRQKERFIEMIVEKAKKELELLDFRRKVASEGVRLWERNYLVEAQKVKTSIMLLEHATQRQDEARQQLKAERRKYSSRARVKELKENIRVMEDYKDDLISERQQVMKQKDELLDQLNAARAGVENKRGYLNSMKFKSEWWLRELRERMKHKTASLKAAHDLVVKEQTKLAKLQKDIQDTEKVRHEVEQEVGDIHQTLVDSIPVIQQLRFDVNAKLPRLEAAKTPISSSKQTLINHIRYFEKAIDEERELIRLAMDTLRKEIIKYDHIISEGMEQVLLKSSSKQTLINH